MSLNPRVAAVFWWGTLHRQVRVQGTVEKVSEAEADAYFATRPRGHQLAAGRRPKASQSPIGRCWRRAWRLWNSNTRGAPYPDHPTG
jgi:pyridoxine/pyridoxamine 5'-phosphate oxidase